MSMHNPRYPGRVAREYLGALPATAAAEHLCISRVALSQVLNGHAGISARLALRLGDALGTSTQFCLAMQSKDDLWQAAKGRRKRIDPLNRTAA